MENKDILFSVGFDRKYGGFDFCVRTDVVELSFEEIDKLRSMIVSAIGTMEDMWRREEEEKNKGQVNSAKII